MRLLYIVLAASLLLLSIAGEVQGQYWGNQYGWSYAGPGPLSGTGQYWFNSQYNSYGWPWWVVGYNNGQFGIMTWSHQYYGPYGFR
jgi:hypothetical protein